MLPNSFYNASITLILKLDEDITKIMIKVHNTHVRKQHIEAYLNI
jgi:hypothetical protein